MKGVTTIPALVLVAAACASFTAYAATAAHQAKAADAQAEKTGDKVVPPHNHMQDRTGTMPQKKSAKAKPEEAKPNTPAAPEESKPADTKSKKLRADKDKSRHYHPRDGK